VPARSNLTLAALASVAVPGLDPVAVGAPQVDGMDFDVAVVDDSRGRRWVVRVPRRTTASAMVDLETRLLPRLAAAVPFAVPQPAGHCALPDGGRGLVYPYLPGAPLHPGELRPGTGLAPELGRALARLHDVPPEIFDEAGAPTYTAEEYRQRRLSDVDRAAATGHVPATLLARWESALEQVSHWRFAATPVHGDLAAEHVLVDDGRVSGIIDWGEARVADPADDLAWVAVGADSDALDAVLESYAMARSEQPDRHLLDRAQLAGELAFARWLLGGVAADDTAVVDQASAALAELAERVEPPE
jgi:aminoglycoside phosphotransferase (APT) family kinase protein